MWCVVKDRTSRVICAMHVKAGADLETLFAQITAEVAGAGWTIEDHIPWMGNFFCHRAGQRLCVGLQPAAPSNPFKGWPLPTPAASVKECLPK
jgi:hypothetical protein